jgi:hypothetical protein
MRVGCAIALLALIGCAAVRVPERRLSGGISGTVVDSGTGAPLPGAVILLRRSDGGFAPPALCNDKGEFILVPLAEGKHDFVVQHAGYETASASNVAVETGYYTTVAVKLVPGGPAAETPLKQFDIVPPVLISGPAIKYPDVHPQLVGTVRVRCVLTAEGIVKDCVPDQEVPELAVLIRQLEARRYQPALQDGKPVDVWYTFRINLNVW